MSRFSSARRRSTLASSFLLCLASIGATGAVAVAPVHAQPVAPVAPTQPVAARPIEDPMLAPLPAASRSLATWAQAQELLLGGSSDLARAEATLIRAEAQLRQALAVLLPTARLTVTGAFDLDNPDSAPNVAPRVDDRTPTSPVGIASISLSQRLVDVASWRSRDAAALARDAARWALADAQRRVRQRLARTLVAVVVAERVAELGRVGLSQALERAALGQRTFELGRATELDVVRARQDVTAARTALVIADEQLRVSREALALALGSEEPIGVSRSLSLDGLVGELTASCQPLIAGGARADERAAEATVQSLATRASAARAGKLPTLDLTTTLTALTTDPGPGRVSTWSIVALLSVPLWEGGLRSAQARERDALTAEARVGAEELRRGVRVEIVRARRALEVGQSLLAIATEGQALAERLDQMTRRSFEMGRATSLELVQSAVGLRQAELTLALRQLEWMQARIDALLAEASCAS